MQFPRYGSCQKIYSDVYFLGITIAYRLRANWNKLKYGTKDAAEYSITRLGQAIRRQMYNDLGLGQCGSCRGQFYKSNTDESIGNARLPAFLELSPIFYAYGRKCSENIIIGAMSNIIGKELIVYLDDEEYVTFDVEEIEHSTTPQENMSDLSLSPFEDDDGFCRIRLTKSYRDLNKCPMVKLDTTHNQSLMSLADTAELKNLVKSLFAVDGGPDVLSTQDNTTSVCWEDYRKLVTRLTSSSRRSSGNLFVTVTTVLVSIIWYYVS